MASGSASSMKKIVNFPGKAKSEVWKTFGFYSTEDGIDKSKAVCKICKAEYAYKGIYQTKLSFYQVMLSFYQAMLSFYQSMLSFYQFCTYMNLSFYAKVNK